MYEADVLRAIAIVIIVFYHAHSYFDHQTYAYTLIDSFDVYLINFGLGLFFFISGYLLYHNNPGISSVRGVFDFYRKRVFRIYPLYWVALLISIICFAYLGMYYYNPNDFSPGIVVANFLGLQFVTGTTVSTFWFVGVILVFYALYPLLVAVAKRPRDIALASVGVTAIILGAYALFNQIDSRLYLYLMVFAAGIIARKAGIFETGKVDKYVPALAVCLVSTLAVEAFIFSGGYFAVHSISVMNVLGTLTFIVNLNLLMISLSLLLYWVAKKYVSTAWYEKLLLPQISYGSYAAYLFDPICFGAVYAAAQFFGAGGNLFNGIVLAAGFPLALMAGYPVQKMENEFRQLLNGRIHGDLRRARI